MVIAGTGHRPNKLGGYGPDVQERLRTFAINELLILRPDRLISGMALGWDQALAEASIELGIPFEAYVPFKGQERVWPRESRLKYEAILHKAKEVLYVCPPDYAPWKMQKRNEAMVDAGDQVLALWDGTPGGTGNCVRYAETKGRPIINCWERWKQWS